MREGGPKLIKAFVAIGGLIVVALCAVLVAPHFIDWSAYRADFEREATRILGQPVVVRGEADVRILPFPSVVFSRIEVGRDKGRPLLTADRFRMDAELAPYLSGEIRIFSMRLENPVLRLDLAPDGRLGLGGAVGSLPTAATVVLEDVAIENGSIDIADAGSGARMSLRKIDGTFAAQSLLGPVSGGGSLLADGRPFVFQLSSGQKGEKGLPVRLTVEDRALRITGTTDGFLTIEDDRPRFAGTLRAATLDAAAPRTTASGDAAAPPPEALAAVLPRFAATGALAASPARLDLTDLRLAVGEGQKPYVLTGSGAFAGGAGRSFSLDLEGEQIDIDDLGADRPEGGAATFEGRVEAARRLLAAVPKPALDGRAVLRLPVVVAGDTTIRGFSVEASPTPKGWLIRRFAAELPGRARLEADGRLDLADGALGFDGSLLLAARQPSGFSEWLTGSVDPAVRALPQAGFAAAVTLTPDKQSFRNLEIDLGGDTLTGRLERSGPPDARRIDADLSGGRLDLDAFVALSRLFTGEAESVADARTGSLKVKAGPVSYAGASAERIDADLSYDGRSLQVDHAAIRGIAGGDVTVKGSLSDLDRDIAGSLDIALSARQPGPLVAFLAQRLPASRALDILRRRAPSLGPLDLTGTLHTSPGQAGERPTLDVQVSGKAARSDIALSMLLGNGIYAGASAGNVGLNLSMRSSASAELLEQIGVGTVGTDLPSPLALELSLSAGATGPVAAQASLQAPGTLLGAEGTLAITADSVARADLALSGTSQDFAPWLVATGNGFGLTGLEPMPGSLAGSLGIENGRVALTDLEGSLGPTDFSGALEWPANGPAGGRMFLSSLSVPWLASLVYGRAVDGDAAASGRWPKAEFGQSLQRFGPFGLDVTADRVELGGGAAVGEASVHLEGQPGELTLTDLRGAIGGGYGTATLRLRNANGIGAFTASADLQGIDLGAVSQNGFALPDEEADDAPPPGGRSVEGVVDATVRLDGSGQSYAGLVAALTGAGRIAVEKGVLAGLDDDPLAAILKAADVQGFEPQQANVSALVSRLAAGSRSSLPPVASDFSVVGGVARLPPTSARTGASALVGEASLDLGKGRIVGSIRQDLDAGDEAVDGAAPSILYSVSGPLARPLLTPDVQLLANFLSVRALEREQARVEAIQGALQEKLRLRREVRYDRWREAERVADEERAATGEKLRLDRLREEEGRRQARAAEERARREAAEQATRDQAARKAEQARAEAAALAEERRRAAAAAANEREDADRRERLRRAAEPQLDLGTIPAPLPSAPPASTGASSLPGVRDPFAGQGLPATGG